MFCVSALVAVLAEVSGNAGSLDWSVSGAVDPNTTFIPVMSSSPSSSPSVTMGVGDDTDVTKLHAGSDDWPNEPHNVSFLPALFVSYCAEWKPVNHVYFQLANTFFFLSYLAPNGMYGILYLRCTLLVGCAFFALWGWAVLCCFDAFLWNATFVGINFIHVCILLYYLRPVKFTREVEEVYLALFQPLKVTRHQFKKVLNCMKMIRQLKYQEVYAQEKATKVDSLSLVLSGKLVVSQNGRALHIVFPHQFLDSPEWFGVSTDEYFQVSETMAASNNGHLPNSLDDGEDKPMLIVKKTGDGPGITALINRQLQAMPRIRYYYCAADPNAWRLGRIEEGDHETPV
ncbi:blood vessel epicardial substance-like isoform X2 [Zootermopsis nevadensis]|uniref:blood vessel epicardial substance-like isoform X2 n=1 Tax=Zootermopsis nevadensis TaxID=136037 RepID=UPI000B8E2E50|nr:blood vessel epicardial substance-like isoform X2 [Zootermopsis nevadensis]